MVLALYSGFNGSGTAAAFVFISNCQNIRASKVIIATVVDLGMCPFLFGAERGLAGRTENFGNARVALRFCRAKNENPSLPRTLGVGGPLPRKIGAPQNDR